MMICIVLFSVRQYKKFEQKIREQPESNRRPQDLQSYALPLSYTPGMHAPWGCNTAKTSPRVKVFKKYIRPITTSAGFEPTRA